MNLTRFIKFLVVGATATALHYLVMAALLLLDLSTPLYASAIGFIVSAIYNYWANARFTFGGNFNHARSLPRFLVTALIGLLLNQVFLAIGLQSGLPLIASQLLATACVFIWNYVVNAVWSFSRRSKRT